MGFLGDLITSIAGPIVSGVFGIGAGAQQGSFNREQMEWQSNENKIAREFNAEESQKNRDFQETMWNMQNRYNDPSAAVGRILRAGVNPNRLFTQGGTVMGQSTNLPSGSAASASPASVPSLMSPASVGVNAFSAFLQSVSGALKNVSDSNLSGAKKDEVYQNIKNLMSQEQLTKLQSEAQDLANDIVRMTGKEKASAEIHQLVAETAAKIAEKAYTEELTENEREKYFTYYWQGLETKMKALLGQTEFEKAQIALTFFKPQLQAMLANIKADSAAKRASAVESSAHAKLYDSLKVSEDSMRELRKYLLSDEHALNVRTIDSKVKLFFQNAKAAEINVFNEKLKAYDAKAYNALQRLLHGKASQGDRQLLLDVFRGLSDADMLSGAAPVLK